MKKGLIILLVVVALVLVAISWVKNSYNGLIVRQEAVSAQMGNLQSQYQRRADLIPNLVSTVKGYAAHEESTLTAVIEARAKATQTQVNIQDAEAMAQYMKNQGEISSALSRLMVVSEQYPDLKANQNFRDLQTQLEGTENRIAVERRNYNDTARQYNMFARTFPRNMIAGMFNFDQIDYFEAQEGAQDAPVVAF